MRKAYDQLHVVSDLHMGGRDAGRQIFNQGDLLAGLIDDLRGRTAKTIGFVMNGDIVDFLAEPDATEFDTYGAATRLDRIMKDDSFKMVWEALRKFVGKRGRELILVLGNHDVELALPNVRELLLHRLCRNSEAARGRVHFAMDGAGFACTVGGRDVLCLHGNEVDDWNVVDYQRLLRVKRAVNRQRVAPDWVANAGTSLVIGVMNEIKQRYPFVDLLKPELAAVVPILFALDDEGIGWSKKLWRMKDVLMTRSRDGRRMKRGLLRAGSDADDTEYDHISDEFVDSEIWGERDVRQKLRALLEETETAFEQGTEALDLVETEKHGELALWAEMRAGARLVWNRLAPVGAESRNTALREALKGWLRDDDTFALDNADSTFRQIVGIVDPELDFVVAGHTHLRRTIPRGQGFYFNTGTWARLIRLPTTALDSDAEFKEFFDKITVREMDKLDTSPDLVVHQPTVASIEREGDQVHGRLREVALDKSVERVLRWNFIPDAIDHALEARK